MLDNLEIFELKTIDSTNNFLLTKDYHSKHQLCIAKIQTKGRGQYGRIWQQQQRSALFSLKIKLPASTNISGLSLVMSLTIVRILEKNYNLYDLQIKWPNDIFLANNKLGGILIETQFDQTAQYIIIGVGLNIASTDFASIGQNINTKQLILRIVEKMLSYIDKFKMSGFSEFINKWQQYDLLKNQQIAICYKNQLGTSKGVDETGCLIFENSDNQVIIHSSSQIVIKL